MYGAKVVGRSTKPGPVQGLWPMLTGTVGTGCAVIGLQTIQSADIPRQNINEWNQTLKNKLLAATDVYVQKVYEENVKIICGSKSKTN